VKQTFKVTLGVCEACNTQFTSNLPQPDQSQWEIRMQFDRHTCKPEAPPSEKVEE
jgi:hypothetical protein